MNTFKNWIEKKLRLNDDVDLSKIKVIKTAAGLAALTVVAGAIPLGKKKSIQEKIKSGIVANETFYLSGPVIIDIPGVEFNNCRFEANKPMP